MICTRCESDLLYEFKASPGVKGSPNLPVVCRECGQIHIAGIPVEMPEELEKQAVSMADMAVEAGSSTREKLEEDSESGNNVRVENYFSNVYQRGYLDGFFRCLSVYKHQAKEGRISRLRELWGKGIVHKELALDGDLVFRGMSSEAYTEFEKLLHTCVVPGKHNAKNPSHKHQTNDKSTSPLSR